MKDNAFLNILFNVILPVMILNKLPAFLSHPQAPLIALVLALSLPLTYGAVDFFTNKKMNYIALLGVINILFTGGFALFKLSGEWFSLKEAFFPLLIGLFVLFSAWTKKPFIKTLILNPNVMNLEVIDAKLSAPEQKQLFDQHVKTSTVLLSGSFFLSSFLNYYLASKVFIPIQTQLEESVQSQMLNEQIAEMTSKSFLVIMVPSMICLMLIMWYLISGIQKQTGLGFEDILKVDAKKS